MSDLIEVLVTGTSWGIGEAIVRTLPDGYRVIGVERNEGERGLPEPGFIQDLLDVIEDGGIDVFVNNAYGAYDIRPGEDPNPQLTLFYEVLKRWQRLPGKTIINICSMAAYYGRSPIPDQQAAEWQRRYRGNKLALLNASEQATLDGQNVLCHVSALSPGHVRTKRTETPKHADTPKLTAEQCAGYVWWLIQQPPAIRIPHLSVFAVNPT